MITPKIKALFHFIEYLHSNIDNFKKYDDIINRIDKIQIEISNLNPKKHYLDKINFDKLTIEKNNHHKTIVDFICTPIINKAIEMDICGNDNSAFFYFKAKDDIDKLFKNFSNDDIIAIHNYKEKYIEFKDKTHIDYFGLQFFYKDLDEVLISLFSFFNNRNVDVTFKTNIRPFSEFVLEKIKEKYGTTKNNPPQPIVKQKPEQETPKTFDELFYNADLVKPCIDILKELDPPLIDTDCNYIGKLKGVFCVWIDEMQRQGIVKSNYPEERKLFASLIPQKIKRFSIDESMFGKHQNKAENLYRTDIKTKVSKIKLSQNSQ
jgi:hypothetical protein